MFPAACYPKSQKPFGPGDPLADIDFFQRNQAFFKKGVPLGLFTDAGGTIPCINGDPAEVWADMLSASGLSYSQDDPTMKAIVAIDAGGVVFLQSSQETTAYPAAFITPSQDYAISMLCRATQSGLRIINSSTRNALIDPFRGGLSCFVDGVISTNDIPFDGLWHVASLVAPPTGNMALFIDGVDVTTGAMPVLAFGGVALWKGGSQTEGQTGDLSAVLVYPSAYRARVDAYLAGLPL